jgi:hypothetical protein
MTGDDGAIVEVAAIDDGSLLPEPEPVEEPGVVTTFPAEPTVDLPAEGPTP